MTLDLGGSVVTTPKTEKDPIAIVGIGCRFPGGVNDPTTFWRLLRSEVDAIGEIPPDRFDIDAFYDPKPATPGKIITRQGGFLEKVTQFDANFFGISPREANRLDPQHRLLLEVTWEALEDAGVVINQLIESETGVFLGLSSSDYRQRMFADPTDVDFYSSMGGGNYSASGRISYLLGLQGPSITINTHFSSSLVAVHYACRSLWQGECTMALAGGANLILQPHTSVAYSRSQMLAPDARSKFADARANGYVRSEGGGVVVLKPLAQAVADKDPIYAIIRGSAVNNNGRSGGFLSAPGQRGQEALLRKAYQDAGISPGRAQYVEAHGTGTKIGDSVELQALGAVMGQDRPVGQPCLVGSVKTNFGHTEAAAGIAGLIKVALMLKYRSIPASLHLQKPTPDIPWQKLPLKIPTTLTPWTEDVGTATASVSSFGITGTNAHVVLTEAPQSVPTQEREEDPDQMYLLPLSAHTPAALQALARTYKTFLAAEWAPSLHDICYTASCRRMHMMERLALVADSHEEMVAHLDAFLQGELDDPNHVVSSKKLKRQQRKPDTGSLDIEPPNRKVIKSTTSADSKRPAQYAKVAFVFAGQGSQWIGMGQELMAQEPVFRETLEACEEAMQPFVDWSLCAQLSADEDSPEFRLDEINVIQPTLCSIQIALAALWQSWGVLPDAVIGHSMGEIAATYVAGALTLTDAMRVICHRSRLMRRTSGQGAMAVIELSMEAAQAALVGYEDSLSVAASNGPFTSVLSGDPEALDAVLETLRKQGIFCRLVKVDVASHSPFMEPLREELVAALQEMKPRNATIPIYSATLGTVMEGAACDAVYWGKNLRQPVLFSKMIQQLLTDHYDVFIEAGPHPILLPSIQRGVQHADRDALLLPSLRRDETEMGTLLTSLGDLYRQGYFIAWSHLYQGTARHVRIPLYQWQRETYWLDSAVAGDEAAETPQHDNTPSTEQQKPFREQLMAATLGRRRQSLFETHLREQVGRVLRMPPSQVPLDSPLKTLGLDSLMTVELRNRLEASLELTLSSTLIWNYPTIEKLVPFLAGKMEIPLQAASHLHKGGAAKKVTTQTTTKGDDDLPAALAQLETISENEDTSFADDVESLLADELAAIEDLLQGGRSG